MGLIILGVGCTVNMLELVRDQKLIVIPNWWNKEFGSTKDICDKLQSYRRWDGPLA
jgi:hypothetical protein